MKLTLSPLRPLVATAALLVPGVALAVNNPVTQFPIEEDGHFSGGVVAGHLVGEWSDVTPLAFISPATSSGPLFSVPVGDPRANSLLYGVVAVGSVSEDLPELYLMYDYLPRTDPSFEAGEHVADIAFPMTVGAQKFNNAKVVIQGAGGSLFNVLVDLGDGITKPFSADALGIDGSVGFGPSTLSAQDHMLIELGVPLRIPPGFGAVPGPFPPGGQPGIYSPEPSFWGADIANDDVDPPASSAIFQILPNGSTTIFPAAIQVPDAGSTALLLMPTLLGLSLLSRRYSFGAISTR